MISLEEAGEKIGNSLGAGGTESIALDNASGRFLAEELCSHVNLPPFDNSAMDGYAVIASDTAGASSQRPATLKIIGEVPAGEIFESKIGAGECVRIFTGSPLPAGANAVVMQEDTERADSEVRILDAVRPFEHIRLLGEDVKTGQSLAKPGRRVTPGLLNLLAACGHANVTVGRAPRIGILATGSELKEPGQPLSGGEIYESNRVMLASLIADTGAVPVVFPLVPDTLEATATAFREAFRDCDAIVTSGGVSVGEHDYVKAALVELGGSLDLWRVKIKPGKPFAFGRVDDRFMFGLPGNPVSAFATFLMLVRPALLQWQGAERTSLPVQIGTLREPLVNRGNRRHFVRVRIDDAGDVTSAGTQASHMLHSLAEANGLIDVPPETTLEEGAAVAVQRCDLD
jgi:molybdopterin molybdotransferase